MENIHVPREHISDKFHVNLISLEQKDALMANLEHIRQLHNSLKHCYQPTRKLNKQEVVLLFPSNKYVWSRNHEKAH